MREGSAAVETMIATRPSVLTDCTRVFLAASDPISLEGVASQIRSNLQLVAVDERQVDGGVVALVVVDEMDAEARQTIGVLRRRGVERLVLIVTRIDEGGLLSALEAGVRSVLQRSQATPEKLFEAIRAATDGDGVLTPDLLGRLMDQVVRLQRHVLNPRGLNFAVLGDREIKLLKLLADGLDTAEVGRRMFCSERTVKNIVHDVMRRLNVRNRTQAVAYAVRHGWV